MNILIIGPSWVGDMVMAQCLLACLRKQYSDCQIDVLAPPWSFALLERMPEVRRALSFPLGHGVFALAQRRKIGQSLKGQYDQAIILPNSLKSALVPFFADIKQRTGWLGEMRYGLLNDWRKLDKQRYPLMIERFMALAYPANRQLTEPYPKPSLQINENSRAAALSDFSLNLNRQVLALCPGAEFGERDGWQVWIFGSASDRAGGDTIGQQLAENLRPFAHNLAGKTTLAQAIDLLSFSSAVVSNDSGLMHVAAALNRPLVAVYGSTSPKFTPPLSEQVQVVQLGLPCSPCFERTCRFGHYHCLKKLMPQPVISALNEIS